MFFRSLDSMVLTPILSDVIVSGKSKMAVIKPELFHFHLWISTFGFFVTFDSICNCAMEFGNLEYMGTAVVNVAAIYFTSRDVVVPA